MSICGSMKGQVEGPKIPVLQSWDRAKGSIELWQCATFWNPALAQLRSRPGGFDDRHMSQHPVRTGI